MARMKIALVHDWLNQMGGAEDVLETLVGMYPEAPVYTSMYWRQGMPKAYREWDIRTTWMDRLPGIYRHHQPYLPLYPLAFSRLDLSDYQVVLSNKDRVASTRTCRTKAIGVTPVASLNAREK